MADDKLKTGPESPVLDHPGGGPAGDAQAVTKPPVPEEVEGPAAGTGPAPQPEQSVIPGMGKDAPAQPAPQVEQSWLQAQRRSAVGCQFLAYSSHLAHR